MDYLLKVSILMVCIVTLTVALPPPSQQLSFDDRNPDYDNYQSALNNKNNLKSKQYESFIAELYRFDHQKEPQLTQLFGHKINARDAPAPAHPQQQQEIEKQRIRDQNRGQTAKPIRG